MIKEKFVKYLTEGIDVHIPDDEIEMFYKSVTEFINEAPNEFEAYHLKNEGCVLISDKYLDYIKFFYENDKVLFKHVHATNESFYDSEFVLKMGLAFLGVLIFIESLAPSEDSALISRKHHDQWRL